MTTLSHMLLLYDGTAESQAALSRCKQLSLALKAHVDVVSVVDPDSANATCAGMLSELAYAYLEELGRRTLSTAVDELIQHGVTAHGYLSVGCKADAIFRHAASSPPDIVVIGHRLQRGLARWWGERPVHVDLADRLRGSTIVTVTLPDA
ncbi:universal stress protein [bacterium M00.F.Ca.ET.228.01.1.1]|uniref:universal stress protein n=1 Tax=Paraburkholderia phenoliruptrix TaxID=252970 RepID=UPI0010927301|nr:universal stress protein [Paraburkholderia phenoliruptrix]MBW9127490.1 universal stress protein [Paraburkholderia ginsengiterrae]TGP46166.1 universal stress protein [bacterium M00.F.Ca.ET.228.01.1.1]TGS03921.1 universal stress protein [bacterium M00.F.Ca.ET.191.01.1.1]TGU07459.1 universal stress protein [bacterium M00.F.Ca.ET.155.01.1.1]MBW0446716.1 universal stress protein [Paraburkholderia phenoliruptrix]